MDKKKKPIAKNPVKELIVSVDVLIRHGIYVAVISAYLYQWQKIADGGKYVFNGKNCFIMSAANLAAATGMGIYSASSILKSLEDNGIISRFRNKNLVYINVNSEKLTSFLITPL